MSMLEKALAQDKEKHAFKNEVIKPIGYVFKNEVIKPIGKEIIELLRKHELTAKQGQDVIRYVVFEIIKIAENAKL